MAAEEQLWSAERYAANAHFVPALAGEVTAWLDARPGERVLDLGCGDGVLTERLAATGATVVGVDASDALLAAARARGLDARAMDGRALTFDREFDAVFSNAVLHWIKPPEDVVAGVACALRPGGRLVAEFGGFGNVAAIATAMRAATLRHGGDPALANPWYFPTVDEYAALLRRVGFRVDRTALVPRQTPLPTGMRQWLLTFREAFFTQYEPGLRDTVLDDVTWALEPQLRDSTGAWTADYVRLRVAATLEDGSPS